jgi:hypothetical protein
MDVDPRGSTDNVDDGPTEDIDPRGSTSPTRHPLFPNARMEDFDSSHRGVNSRRPPSGISPARTPFRNDVPPANPYQPSRPVGLTLASHATRGDLDNEEEASLGGQIIFPRNAECRWQALASKISPMDIACLGNMRYHGGTHGYIPLTMTIIHNCSFTELNTNDVILSHNDIIHLHTKVLAHWDHPRGNYSGPQVDRIIEKGLSSFPHLTTLIVDAAVEFYDSLHKLLLIYLLLVMPFDCISLKMGFKVLCLPGLGLPSLRKDYSGSY